MTNQTCGDGFVHGWASLVQDEPSKPAGVRDAHTRALVVRRAHRSVCARRTSHGVSAPRTTAVSFSVSNMNRSAPRSRRQVAARSGVKISTLRALEQDGLLPTNALTGVDELVVRALMWADGGRGADRDHEHALAEHMRKLAHTNLSPRHVIVLCDGQVTDAEDLYEAAYLFRHARSALTVVPVGAWFAELDAQVSE